ncbi:MAG: homoserine dehydrogenase [Acutalibacteraceae bacterium]|nr:homoserine dehydrogenase [Acutalibacteraceae bacterium]
MNVAIMGFGVVGSGVAELITKNSDSIEKNSDVSLKVTRILDIRDFENNEFAPLMTKSFEDILEDDTIEIVVETMGGVNPAFDFVSKCLNKGKHVVSSNKELVATKGFELLEMARKNNVNFLFEASVGGGIPIIRPISRCLAGNQISEIAGILNGTSNFILTKMIVDGMSFSEALKLAQDKGYAEKDPTADVEGFDALRKICILASLAFGNHVYPDGIFTEGISKITLEDVAYAENYNSVIKLIAKTKKLQNGRILVMVSPCLVNNESMLSGVNGVFNACLVRGDATGDVLMYGKGAGKLATASAVVGDVIDCASNDEKRKFFGWDDAKEDMLADYLDCETALYIRTNETDKAKLTSVFGDVTFLSRENQPENEIAFVTPVMKEGELRQLIDNNALNVSSCIRVADY